MTATMSLRELILLQQCVDEVFSDLAKVGLEDAKHLEIHGAHPFDPSKHPRGWHGYFIKGIDSVPAGYHKATAKDYTALEKRGDILQPPKVHRALVVANDPDAAVQWKARAQPSRGYPNGKWIEGRTSSHTKAALDNKFDRVDQLIKSKKHQVIGRELAKRLAHPDQYPTIRHVDSKGKASNTARSPETVRDTAAVLTILHKLGMRIGSATGEGRGKVTSYGAVSLQRNHVRVINLRGQKGIEFEFTSKGGKEIGPATKNDARGKPKTPLYATDPALVKMFEDAIARTPDKNGRLFPNTTDRLTTDMLHEIGGEINGQSVKQHDLRTAAATRLAADLVEQSKPNINSNTTQADADATWNKIVEHVASMLTDEHKEAEDSYISTSVKRDWDRITKNVKPTPVTPRQVASARRSRSAARSGSQSQPRKASGLGTKATGVPAAPKKQRGPGARGRTPVKAPSTPKIPAAPLPTLLGRERKLMDAIEGYDIDLKHMQGKDPHAFRDVILQVQQKRARAIDQLNQVRKLIGKSSPDSSEVNTNVPIGVVDLRLAGTQPARRRKRPKMDRQQILNETVVYKRFFSTADRKKMASTGDALPNGSYPIPDKDALRRAAILARSGHGNVAAAKALIRRKAAEFGVRNPLGKK